MPQFTPRQKFYFLLGGILFSLLVLLFLVVLPRFRAITKGFQELQTVRRERAALEFQLASLHEFAKGLPKFDRTLQEIQESAFVASEAPIEFVQFLENTAADSVLTINIASALPVKGKVFENALFFDIEIEGAGSNVLRFLSKLEKAPYLIELQNFRLQGLQGQDAKTLRTYPLGSVSGRISLLVYSR